jgi:hypothetical protein
MLVEQVEQVDLHLQSQQFLVLSQLWIIHQVHSLVELLVQAVLEAVAVQEEQLVLAVLAVQAEH